MADGNKYKIFVGYLLTKRKKELTFRRERHSELIMPSSVDTVVYPIYFRFKQAKGLAMLEYLLDQFEGKYNYMALLKLAYLADRQHLRSYARPISFDYYKAMRLGALPQNLYNNVTSVNLPDSIWENAVRDHYVIKLKHKPSHDGELSESDRRAMQWAIDKFGAVATRNEFDIANLTHAYPEWDRFRNLFQGNRNTSVHMYYEDFVKNADPKHEEFQTFKFKDPFKLLASKEQEEILEEIAELSQNL